MKIAINLEEKSIEKLNNFTGGKANFCIFEAIADVYIVLENSDQLESDVAKACSMIKPVIVLIKNNEKYNLISDHGLFNRNIFYKQGNELKNYANEVMKTKIPRGVGTNALLELATFAIEQGLIPELIIWNPEEEEVVWNTQDNITPVEPFQAQKHKQKSEEPQIINLNLNDFLNNFKKIVLLLKTVENSDISNMIEHFKEIETFSFLDLSKECISSKIYASDLQLAVKENNYSYLSTDVIYTNDSIKGDTLLIEIDMFSDLIDTVYPIAEKVIIIPSNDTESLDLINGWVENKHRLDYLLVQDADFSILKNKVTQKVYTVQYATL